MNHIIYLFFFFYEYFHDSYRALIDKFNVRSLEQITARIARLDPQNNALIIRNTKPWTFFKDLRRKKTYYYEKKTKQKKSESTKMNYFISYVIQYMLTIINWMIVNINFFFQHLSFNSWAMQIEITHWSSFNIILILLHYNKNILPRRRTPPQKSIIFSQIIQNTQKWISSWSY